MTYQPWLVCSRLSWAIQGAYVGLSLAYPGRRRRRRRRRLMLEGAAMSLRVAIRDMHFGGMLAVRVPLSIDHISSFCRTLCHSLSLCLLVVPPPPPPRAAGLCHQRRPSHVDPPHFVGLIPDGKGIFTMHLPVAMGAS